MARRRVLGKPVKAEAARAFGSLRATGPAAGGRPKARQRQAVKKALPRGKRFRLQSVKHSMARARG